MCVMKAMPTNTPFYSTLNWIQSTYDSESTQCAFNLGPYFTLVQFRESLRTQCTYVDSCAMPTDRVCVCYLCSKPFKLGVYIMLSLGNTLHICLSLFHNMLHCLATQRDAALATIYEHEIVSATRRIASCHSASRG